MRLANIQKQKIYSTAKATLQNFVFNTKEELINLPDVSTLSPGSSILISSTGTQYILDQFKKWQKIAEPMLIEEDQAKEIVYDGGELK